MGSACASSSRCLRYILCSRGQRKFCVEKYVSDSVPVEKSPLAVKGEEGREMDFH